MKFIKIRYHTESFKPCIMTNEVKLVLSKEVRFLTCNEYFLSLFMSLD